MKNKGKKLLQTQKEKTEVEIAKDQQDKLSCVFCQETLGEKKYMDGPYGQFTYVQTSKLMFHTIK
jgi:intracellular sulfur oxidation DsrE/DsrF family protein